MRRRRTRHPRGACLPFAGLMTGALLSGAPLAAIVTATATQAQEALPRDIGRPLQDAQELAKKSDFPGAMAKVNEAAAAHDKTAYASFVIEEMRASVAQQSGDLKTAISADDALLASGRIPSADRQRLLMAEASSYYQLHDYAGTIKAIQRYEKAGGNPATLQQLKIQCYYLLKDYPHAAAEQSAQIEAEIKANKTPSEQQLQLLASCQIQSHDEAGLTQTMTRLVEYYPKPQYWAQLLQGLRANPDLPPGLDYDVDRIRLAVGLLGSTSDFMDMTELAVQQGLPGQALDVMNKGYAAGALGKGAEAARQARLRALVEQTIASKKASLPADEAAARRTGNSNAMLAVGYTAVDLGQSQQGIALMREAITKGGLSEPDAAMLHLGLAYKQAGETAEAIRMMQAVGGHGAAAELAHLWMLQLGHP